MKFLELTYFAIEAYCDVKCCADLPMSIACRDCPLYEFIQLVKQQEETDGL